MAQPGVYKFTDERFVENVANGEFWLGSTDLYRIMEIVWGRYIGDRFDGITDYRLRLNSENPGDLEKIAQSGIVQWEGADVGTIDIDLIRRAKDTSFILSIAYGDFDELFTEFSQTRDGIAGYKSAVEITDIELFVEMLPEATVVRPAELAGKRLYELGSELTFGKVEYGKRVEFDGNENPEWIANSFFKDDFFANQREYRYRVPHHLAQNIDHLVIQLPDRCKEILKIRHKEATESVPDVQADDMANLWDEYDVYSKRLKEILRDSLGYDERDMALNIKSFSELERPHLVNFYRSSLERRVARAYWERRKKSGKDHRFESILLSSPPHMVMTYISIENMQEEEHPV